MPRFFFHVLDGQSAHDTLGTELPDIYAAEAEAIQTVGEMLRDLGGKFSNAADWKLEVADEAGQILFVLKLTAEERIVLSDPQPGSFTG